MGAGVTSQAKKQFMKGKKAYKNIWDKQRQKKQEKIDSSKKWNRWVLNFRWDLKDTFDYFDAKTTWTDIILSNTQRWNA